MVRNAVLSGQIEELNERNDSSENDSSPIIEEQGILEAQNNNINFNLSSQIAIMQDLERR